MAEKATPFTNLFINIWLTYFPLLPPSDRTQSKYQISFHANKKREKTPNSSD